MRLPVRGPKWLLAASLGGVLLVGVCLNALGADETSRYPYDPACAWGRLANGKGMLIRCLTEQEAASLSPRVPPAPVPPPVPVPPTPIDAGAVDAGPPPDASPSTDGVLLITVGPVTADEGTLPQAEKKLALPKDRYIGCISQHGGMRGADAEVQVRFLVQAPRGRAEGVTVAKHRGMSLEAAKCIADVVDRRAVGTPDAPVVGATATIKVKRQTR